MGDNTISAGSSKKKIKDGGIFFTFFIMPGILTEVNRDFEKKVGYLTPADLPPIDWYFSFI